MSQTPAEDTGAPDLNTVNDLMDKLTLKQLDLMEEKMSSELDIESSIDYGSIHLARSRYIMGWNQVSAAKLPAECSPDFSASTVCLTDEDDGEANVTAVKNDSDNTINPLRWFGVLVPQDLHKAQTVFQSAVYKVVNCVNVQLSLNKNSKDIEALKEYKNMLQLSHG